MLGGLQCGEHSEIPAKFQLGLAYFLRTEGTQSPLLNLIEVLHLLAKLQEEDFDATLQVEVGKGE